MPVGMRKHSWYDQSTPYKEDRKFRLPYSPRTWWPEEFAEYFVGSPGDQQRVLLHRKVNKGTSNSCMGVMIDDDALTNIDQKYDYEEHGGASYTAYITGMDVKNSHEIDFYYWLHGRESGVNVKQDVAMVYVAYEIPKLEGAFKRSGQVFIRFHNRHVCAQFIANHCKGFQLRNSYFYLHANPSKLELLCPGGPMTIEDSVTNARNPDWMKQSTVFNDQQDYARKLTHISPGLRATCTDFCKTLRVDNPRYNIGRINELTLDEISQDVWTTRETPPGTMRPVQ